MKTKETKTPLLGMLPAQLVEVVEYHGFKPFVGKQLAHWLYQKRAVTFQEMTSLSLTVRNTLQQHYSVGRDTFLQRCEDPDGTLKYLYSVQGQGIRGTQRTVETAVIPDGKRLTVCLSSQVGCRMGCRFCATGAQPFGGNLTAGQILNQLFSLKEYERVTNLVFMGMGEPLANVGSLFRVLEILTASWGCGLSPRRITVSTVGIEKPLERLIHEQECHVAISLHTPYEDQRATLVPASKHLSIQRLFSILQQGHWTGQRRLSFEYVVLAGVNDSPAHMDALARRLKGWPVLVNLIPYHPHPYAPSSYYAPTSVILQQMVVRLQRSGIQTIVRTSRGETIGAACGQLSTTYQRQANEKVYSKKAHEPTE